MILLLHNNDPMCQWLHRHFTRRCIPCLSLTLQTIVRDVSFICHQHDADEIKGLVYRNTFVPITTDTVIYQQLMLCHLSHLGHFSAKDQAYATESWRALFNSFFFNHPNCHNRISTHNLLTPYPSIRRLHQQASESGFNLGNDLDSKAKKQHIITHHIGAFTFATHYRHAHCKKRISLPQQITTRCQRLMQLQHCTVASLHLIKHKETYYFKQFNPFPDWQDSAWSFKTTARAWEALLCPKAIVKNARVLAKTIQLQTTQVKRNAASCFIDLSQRPLL